MPSQSIKAEMTEERVSNDSSTGMQMYAREFACPLGTMKLVWAISETRPVAPSADTECETVTPRQFVFCYNADSQEAVD